MCLAPAGKWASYYWVINIYCHRQRGAGAGLLVQTKSTLGEQYATCILCPLFTPKRKRRSQHLGCAVSSSFSPTREDTSLFLGQCVCACVCICVYKYKKARNVTVQSSSTWKKPWGVGSCVPRKKVKKGIDRLIMWLTFQKILERECYKVWGKLWMVKK